MKKRRIKLKYFENKILEKKNYENGYYTIFIKLICNKQK